jgi:SAM-dependent methyltransferase
VIFLPTTRPLVDPLQAARRGPRFLDMSARTYAAAAGESPQLERVLRERTDVFECERSILAIAPGPLVDRILERLPHAHCRRAATTSSEAMRFDAETFDVAIAQIAALDRGAGCTLYELTRMLRPGGRLVLGVTTAAAAACVERLRTAGFLVARAAGDGDSTVLVGVRGEFAAYAY